MRLGTSIYERGKPKKTSQTKNKSRVKMSSMNKHRKRSFKAYNGQVDREEFESAIRKLRAEVGNLKVQNAEYSQIVKELSDKLKAYSKKFGTVFVKKS